MARRWGLGVLAGVLGAAVCACVVWAQDPPPPTQRANVNGEAILSDALEARQFDLIGKTTIVEAVLGESRQLSRTPSVAADLKSLLAAVVQENPEAPQAEVMAIVQARSVVYTQTLAVRSVKPRLFAQVEQTALDQLIDEQLMLQEGKRRSIGVEDAAIDAAAAGIVKRAGAEGEDLHKLLGAWDKRALPSARARIKARLTWAAALKAKLGAEADEATQARELATLRAAAKIERTAAVPAAP